MLAVKQCLWQNFDGCMVLVVIEGVLSVLHAKSMVFLLGE